MITNREKEVGLFYDRLTGQATALPEPDGLLMGRWILSPTDGKEIFLNSVKVTEEDFLVPDSSGGWSVLIDLSERIEGTVIRQQLPDDLEAESLRIIGERLKLVVEESGTWLEWIDVVPLVPVISSDIDIHPFEKVIGEKYKYLQTVCNNPRAHLHVELDRLPVSRARRTPPNAASYLAAHTEDWASRQIRGIMPKRVLAEVRYDLLNIYENRVVARLLDYLLGYLNCRILRLKKLLKLFQEKEDYSSGATGGTYQRQKRIMALWGDAMDANEGRFKANDTLRKLEDHKYQLCGLMATSLYREVPRRTYVATTLRATNILINDPCYRHIAELWREWSRMGTGVDQTKTAQELNEEKQQMCRGMDRFVMLLIVRALDGLGYVPVVEDEEVSLNQGTSIRMRGDGAEIVLYWSIDGSASIKTPMNELRILPLSVDLKGAKKEGLIEDSIVRILHVAQHSKAKVLVVYAASADGRSNLSIEIQKKLHTVGNDPRGGKSKTGFLPVSSWEIGSTERVSRALRWFLAGIQFNEYPWQFEISQEAKKTFSFAQADWLTLSSKDESIFVELRRPPHDYEWETFNVKSIVEQVQKNLQDSEQLHQQTKDDLNRAVKSGNSTADLNRRKNESYQTKVETEDFLEVIQDVSKKIIDIRNNSKVLLRCPICGTISDPTSNFKSHDNGCFVCNCGDCKSEWGTRLCRSGHKYATMLPSGRFMEPDNFDPGWEDRSYGGDLLALPARKSGGGWGFVCPDCGDVS